MAYVTLTTLDTLASLRASTGLVVDIGEDVAWESIQAALDAHNQLLQESLTGFVVISTKPVRDSCNNWLCASKAAWMLSQATSSPISTTSPVEARRLARVSRVVKVT